MTTATIDFPATLETLTDDQCVLRMRDGDTEFGLGVLRDRHQKRIFRLVNGIVQDTHQAEDVTQEVFTKLFLKSDLYQSGTCFTAWLCGVARNLALSALRSRRRTPRPVGSLHFDSDVGVDVECLQTGVEDRRVEEQDLMAKFEEAVARLPERYQTVFRECVMNGRPYQRVADLLGVPVGTVAIRIMRARKRLYAELAHHIGRIRRPPACVQ